MSSSFLRWGHFPLSAQLFTRGLVWTEGSLLFPLSLQLPPQLLEAAHQALASRSWSYKTRAGEGVAGWVSPPAEETCRGQVCVGPCFSYKGAFIVKG